MFRNGAMTFGHNHSKCVLRIAIPNEPYVDGLTHRLSWTMQEIANMSNTGGCWDDVSCDLARCSLSVRTECEWIGTGNVEWRALNGATAVSGMRPFNRLIMSSTSWPVLRSGRFRRSMSFCGARGCGWTVCVRRHLFLAGHGRSLSVPCAVRGPTVRRDRTRRRDVCGGSSVGALLRCCTRLHCVWRNVTCL